MLNILFKIFSITSYNFFPLFLAINEFRDKKMFVFRSNPFYNEPSKLIETPNIMVILWRYSKFSLFNVNT